MSNEELEKQCLNSPQWEGLLDAPLHTKTIMPININNTHWIIIEADPMQGTFEVHNSLEEAQHEKATKPSETR